MSTPPITALAMITVSGAAKVASRRSSLTPPMNAAARCSAGTSQGPTRFVSLMMASELSWVTMLGRLLRTGAGAVACAWAGRSAVIGARSA